MALAHNLGFPSNGADGELHTAREAFCKGELDEAGLRAVGRRLRARHWQMQKDAGLELLPVGDFAWHDPVLAHSLAFGVIPQHLVGRDGARPSLQTLFAMARDSQPMGTWFGTGEQYCVPQLSVDQSFVLGWEQLFEEVEEARALGHAVKPVLIGPLSYLWLGQTCGQDFDRLELVERLLPLYGQIFQRLAAQGVEWVQIDEPILALDLPQAWKNAYERVYNLLQREPLKKLVATCHGGLEDSLGLAAGLPVDGLHIDLVRAPARYPVVLDRLPAYKVLSLGLIDGGNAGHDDLQAALQVLRDAHERLGERLWVAPSCSLQHSSREGREDGLALAVHTCQQVAWLARALGAPQVGSTRIHEDIRTAA